MSDKVARQLGIYSVAGERSGMHTCEKKWKDTASTTTREALMLQHTLSAEDIKWKLEKINLDNIVWYENQVRQHHGFSLWTNLFTTPDVRKSLNYTVLSIWHFDLSAFSLPAGLPYSTELIWSVNKSPVCTLDELSQGKEEQQQPLLVLTLAWLDTHFYWVPPLSEIQFYAMPCSVKPFHMCLIQN